jgi:hypothetical protein
MAIALHTDKLECTSASCNCGTSLLLDCKVNDTPRNGLGQIQIQLDFDTWTSMDLDLVGYGYPFALDLIGLDYVG